MKIIFLDIDGVLNCQDAYMNGECQYQTWVDTTGKKEQYQQFCVRSKNLLNKLIDETNSKIVISSTWRFSGIDFMRKIWKHEQMHGEIIDITPSFRSVKLSDTKSYTVPRGCEIDAWLKVNGFWYIDWSKEQQRSYINASGIENYIIIDDDSDMLYHQQRRFVHVLPAPRNMMGFNTEHYELAKQMLDSNIIDLNY